MIAPSAGVAFTLADDGDVRNDRAARSSVCRRLGIGEAWATVRQVHGDRVVRAEGPGDLGEADALFTSQVGLPVAVFTADCFGVALIGDRGVGVAHAGWRGMKRRVVARLRTAMVEAHLPPQRAYVGPAIRRCCFEVGPEVAQHFPGREAKTNWGTLSVDLMALASDQLQGLEMWDAGRCTLHEPNHHSHRADQTAARMAAVAWHEPDREAVQAPAMNP